LPELLPCKLPQRLETIFYDAIISSEKSEVEIGFHLCGTSLEDAEPARLCLGEKCFVKITDCAEVGKAHFGSFHTHPDAAIPIEKVPSDTDVDVALERGDRIDCIGFMDGPSVKVLCWCPPVDYEKKLKLSWEYGQWQWDLRVWSRRVEDWNNEYEKYLKAKERYEVVKELPVRPWELHRHLEELKEQEKLLNEWRERLENERKKILREAEELREKALSILEKYADCLCESKI